LIDCFEISCLFDFFSFKIPIPQTLEEELDFICQFNCEVFPQHSNQSFTIFIQQLEQISFEGLNRISNSKLLKTLSSEDLVIEKEDYLSNIITEMIRKDRHRVILLKDIHFEYVSSISLKSFLK
jgi:hypothetical protein